MLTLLLTALGLAAEGVHTVDAGDARLWTRQEGSSSAVPLLMVHGGPGMTAFPFEHGVGPLIARARPVLYTDYRGAGRSSRPAGPEHYSFAILAEDLEKIRTSYAAEKIVLLGHSNGAATALTYARAHPQRVAALVLLCPLLSPRDLEANVVQKVLRHPPAERAAAVALLRKGGPIEDRFVGILEALPPGSRHAIQFASPEGQQRFDAIMERFREETGLESTMTSDLIVGMRRAGFFSFDAYTFASELTMPVLVVGGAADPEVSHENGQLFALTVPDGDYVEIPGAGHHPFVEQPERLAEVVAAFLRTQGI